MRHLQDGYVVDVPYPTFVHRQAMPVWLQSLVQFQGYQAPDIQKPYRYLELGCAMGIHLHLTASANPLGHFVGVDFNAQQLLVADEGLKKTKIDNIEFIQSNFADFLQQDIEPFDFIVTHGVWSWVSPENQKIMVEIVNKLLKKNGILYCSYMCHPGATGLTSIQKLMFEISRNLQGDSATKAMQGVHLARQIGRSNVGLFEKIPSLNEELAALAQDKPSYVAHDFLSEHWQPQHSADMLRTFGKIGLMYAGSAGIVDNIDVISLPPEIQEIVQSLPLITLKETVKDIARNTLQRQDIYVRDRQKLTKEQLSRFYSTIKLGLLPKAPIGQSLKSDLKLGRLYDVIPTFENILKILSEKNTSILQLQEHLKLNIQQVVDIIQLLIWSGYVHPLREDSPSNFSELMNTWMKEQNLPWCNLPNFGTAVEL